MLPTYTNVPPVESKKFPGFYHIPNFERYVIARDGRIIDTVSEKERKYTRVNGYMCLPLVASSGRRKLAKRNRLLCMTFKSILYPELFFVHHINNNRCDDRLENLQWVTPKQNSVYAAEDNLCGLKTPIEVRDWKTKEITRYPGYAEAAKDLGISVSTLHYRLYCNDGRVFPELKQYRYAGDETVNFEDKEANELELMEYGNKKRVLCRNLRTGDVQEFERLTDLAKFLNVCLAVVSRYFDDSDNKQPVVPGLYQLKYSADERPWFEYDDPWYELSKLTVRPFIVVTNTVTGEVDMYESLSACAKARGVKLTAMCNRLRMYKKGHVFPDGCTYDYYDKHAKYDNYVHKE